MKTASYHLCLNVLGKQQNQGWGLVLRHTNVYLQIAQLDEEGGCFFVRCLFDGISDERGRSRVSISQNKDHSKSQDKQRPH